tara:strand:- start:342 stop:710 length:369 start_codon:yes stop_codon:yes gene_type:complete
MSDKLLLGCILENFSIRKDKSVLLKFSTLEQTPEQVGDLHSKTGGFCYLMVKMEKTLTTSEMNEIDNLDTDIMDGSKTQAQRLRDIMWVNWDKNNEGFSDFPSFYKNRMEQMIQRWKNNIDD